MQIADSVFAKKVYKKHVTTRRIRIKSPFNDYRVNSFARLNAYPVTAGSLLNDNNGENSNDFVLRKPYNNSFLLNCSGTKGYSGGGRNSGNSSGNSGKNNLPAPSNAKSNTSYSFSYKKAIAAI